MRNNVKPIVKHTVDKYILDNMVCFRVAGQLMEIDDPDGVITSIITNMDGINTLDDIISQVLSDKPFTTQEQLNDIVSDMNDALLIEDFCLSSQGILSEYDAIRWSRNIDFFGSFCRLENNKFSYQKKLQDTKVALLGIGGLGTHIIYDLVALGVKNIIAVDCDKVELSNLNRQILYSETDIGKNKVLAAQERIDQFYKANEVEFVEMKISSAEDIRKVIRGRNIVICVADKPRMRIQGWLNEACVKEKIPYIHGGLDVKRAMFCTVIPGISGCTECWANTVINNDDSTYTLIEKDLNTDFSTSAPAPAIVTFVSTLTGHMLTDFLKLATGIANPVSLGKLIEIPFDTMRLDVAEEWDKHKDCPVCSAR
jgi:molybdopterin/thiamine biosynthesis adenylyltransferase